MKKELLVLSVLTVMALPSMAEKAWSINTFAVNKVYSSASNTIVCVPWTGYATNEPPSLAVNKLVNSQGLSAGDQMLVYRDDDSYYAWELSEEDGKPVWDPMQVVKRFQTPFAGGMTNLQNRGTGVWVVRKNPNACLYVHGQYATNATSVTVSGGSCDAPSCGLLASPDPFVAVNVNELITPKTVTGTISANDWLSIPTDSTGSRRLYWDAEEQEWYCPREETTTVIWKGKEKKVSKTVHETTGSWVTVPAGTGFWYVRREAGDITINFPVPSFARPESL